MSQVAGIPSSVYASAESYVLISGYDIYDREFHKKLLKRVPKYGALTWMRAVKGYMAKRKTRRHQYYYYEEGQWMSAAATIATVVDQTTYLDITLSAEDHEDTGTHSFPVVGQTVVFEDETVGYVNAVDRAIASAHIVKVKTVNAQHAALLAAAVVGTAMVFYSNVQKEKSTETEGRIPKTSKVTNYVQTFREKYEVTDHAEQNEVEFTYKGQNFLYVKGIDDTADRFMMQEDLGLLINPASSGLTDASSNALTLAKGMIPQITDNGKTMEYFGTPDMTTFDDAIMILNKNYGDHEYVVGRGLRPNLGMKNWLIDFAKNGDNNISFNAFDGGQKQALSFDFQSIYIEPYTFHLQTWDILSHVDTLGAGNMPYQDMMIFIPTGKAKNPEPGEGGEEYEPYIQIVYSPIPGAASENKGDYKMWETGANARSGATDDEATRAIHMMSWKSLELRCRNKFLIARKAA
jgi:hypothetical protein